MSITAKSESTTDILNGVYMALINILEPKPIPGSVLDRAHPDTRSSFSAITGNTSDALLDDVIVKINFMNAVYSADSTNGDRAFTFEILDALNNIVWSLDSGFKHKKNEIITYTFVASVSRELSSSEDTAVIAIPVNFIIANEHTIRARDLNNISMGDSFTFAIGYDVLGIKS